LKASVPAIHTTKKFIRFDKKLTRSTPMVEVFISRRQGSVGRFISTELNDADPEMIEMLYNTFTEYKERRQRRLQ
jgi:hypothetical protein